ncbi:MAG: phenylacetate--CoA ligase family protein [Solirubrobacteraceae bacterium]
MTWAGAAGRADARYPAPDPLALGLGRALQWASRSPFFAGKLRAAGITEGEPVSWEQWRAIPPTTKDELRALRSFEDEVVIVERSEVIEFWRSGGVTGTPLYYPRTRADLDHQLEDFARALRIAGVTHQDTVVCSLPLGIHPAGQLLARAAEHIGAAVIWAGAGSQLPSAAQIELLHRFEATVWLGMASFGLHLAHVAEAAGMPLAESRVRLLVSTAEPLSASKRQLIGRLWGGAQVRDTFGMTEVSMLGAECGRRPGLHMWTETSFCEVLDPVTLQPTQPGEAGLLCVTAKATGSATPFIRWISGDIVRMQNGCECGHPHYPRLIHSGRTAGFLKVKGVNINHAECEERLYAIETLRDFRISITAADALLAELETVPGAGADTAAAVGAMFELHFGLRPDVTVLERGTIAHALADQVKAQRFVDLRPGGG